MPNLRFLRTFLLSLGVGTLSTACGGEDPGKLSEIEADIFKPSCVFAACHMGASAAGGLSLEGSTFVALVNAAAVEAPDKMRVVPSDLAASYLMNKLENRDIVMGTQDMPPGQPLSEARLERIRSWIEAGAAND